MLLRAFLVGVVLTVIPAGAAAAAAPEPTTPPVTANPFIPEDRSITECVSALPKPGCGSEERGGWRQGLILVALVGGLSVIGWRIVAGAKRNAQGAAARLAAAEARDAARRAAHPGAADQVAPPGPPPPSTLPDAPRPR